MHLSLHLQLCEKVAAMQSACVRSDSGAGPTAVGELGELVSLRLIPQASLESAVAEQFIETSVWTPGWGEISSETWSAWPVGSRTFPQAH